MSSGKVLSKSFFDRPTLDVAQDLLGKRICRKMANGEILRLQINEIEAYDGFEDKASHASKGKTERNAVMFGPAGAWYVYLCYGMHWMVNIVVGPEDYPAAILFRGAGDVSGPGRLTKTMEIDKRNNGKMSNKKNGVWIEDVGEIIADKNIKRAPRIGINYAEDWISKPYRFLLK